MASSLKKDSSAHLSGFPSEVSPNENILSLDSLIPIGLQLDGYSSSHVIPHMSDNLALSLSHAVSSDVSV